MLKPYGHLAHNDNSMFEICIYSALSLLIRISDCKYPHLENLQKLSLKAKTSSKTSVFLFDQITVSILSATNVITISITIVEIVIEITNSTNVKAFFHIINFTIRRN